MFHAVSSVNCALCRDVQCSVCYVQGSLPFSSIFIVRIITGALKYDHVKMFQLYLKAKSDREFFGVLSEFVFMSFVKILVLSEFRFFSFLKISVFHFFHYLIFELCHNLSF